MKKPLFRQDALDRLASPEQLDQVMTVTTRRAWLALSALSIVLMCALAWAVFGSLPYKVRCQGILIRRGGLADIVAASAGQVTAIEAGPGDLVEKGQVVARLAQPDIEAEIDRTRTRLTMLRERAKRDKELGTQESDLRTGMLGQERATIQEAINAAKAREETLRARVKEQQALLDRGLITTQALDNLNQEVQRVRESMMGMQAELRRVSAERVGVQRTSEGEQLTASSSIGETEQLLAQLEAKLESNSRIVSSHAGRVLEVRADRGRMVSPGASIITLEVLTDAPAELEAVLYAYSGDGKKIRPGMEVHLSPSVARREVDGVLVAQVTAVAEFPATRAGMLHVLHNDQLVEDFLTATQGAPIAVHARLIADKTTTSGYRWSSGHGPDLKLSGGTPCTASVTTRSERPIALLLAPRR